MLHLLFLFSALAKAPVVPSAEAVPAEEHEHRPLLPSLDGTDPNQWLEEVEGDEALDWVRARNAHSTELLTSDPSFAQLRDKLLSIYDSDERIPYVGKQGDYYYNFWRDGEHAQGVWRRTTPESYRSDKPEWDVLLDLDALSAAEDTTWVWHGSDCLAPEYQQCLLTLSRGGSDAAVVREFDLSTRQFVADGFRLPEAKGQATWVDADTLYIGTDFGEGTLTESGYPRQLRRWTRGTGFADAPLVYECPASDVECGGWADHSPGFERQFAYRAITFYSDELFEVRGEQLLKIDKPDDAMASVHRAWLYLELRSDWELNGETYKAGSLLAADYKKWMKGKRQPVLLFEPTDTTSLVGYSPTLDHVILNVLDDVKSKAWALTPARKGPWSRSELPGLPPVGEVWVSAVDADHGDEFWVQASGFTEPSALLLGEIGGGEPTLLKQLPAFFDATGVTVEQHFATSKDGTRVPYFQVSPPKPAEGSPTLLYGYGGFEVSLTPSYNPKIGVGWLARGGTFVLANIRGGGEYGPRWHQAALKENRHRAYEDFAAVGEDLVARGVTTAEHLGIEGGSNGGLLMGNMYTLYPDHWAAVLCEVPLLDMRRYTHLLAGASWAGEYGDPDDPEQWSYIQTFSPYHNIRPGTDYPRILFTTSTRDDRVHPGHARKMEAALLSIGEDALYFENIEGGHGGAANNQQRATMASLGYTFLWQALTGSPETQEPRAQEAVE